MPNLGSELNKFFAKYSLPTARQLLNVPNDVPVGTVSAKEMEAVWKIAHEDMGKLIQKIQEKDSHAVDIAVSDVVKIAEAYGVPGSSVASTVVPYVCEFVHDEAEGKGKVNIPKFVEALKKSESHMELIKKNLSEGKFKDVTKMSLTDTLDAADVAGGGMYAKVAKMTVLVGFGVAESGSLQSFILDVIEFLAAIGKTLNDIGDTIFGDDKSQIIDNPDGSQWKWDSLQGWVYVPPLERHITRETK